MGVRFMLVEIRGFLGFFCFGFRDVSRYGLRFVREGGVFVLIVVLRVRVVVRRYFFKKKKDVYF